MSLTWGIYPNVYKVRYGTLTLWPVPSLHLHSPPSLSRIICIWVSVPCLEIPLHAPSSSHPPPPPQPDDFTASLRPPASPSVSCSQLMTFLFHRKKNRRNQTRIASSSNYPRPLASTFPPAAVAVLSLLRSRASTLSDTFSVPLRFSLLKDFALMLYSASCLPRIPMCRVNILPVPPLLCVARSEGPPERMNTSRTAVHRCFCCNFVYNYSLY